MPPNDPSPANCPADRAKVIELYFMEHRAKVIDLAAFLDRLDRAAAGLGQPEDFRTAALREAIAILIDGKPHRARRVLELLSDPTDEPISAAPMKGATGAYPARKEASR